MIRLVPDRSLSGPAAIRHDGRCRKVQVNPRIWRNLPEGQRRFIIEHELAHCRHNIFDEQEADRVGFLNFTKGGGNPTDALAALEQVPLHAEGKQRIVAMRQRIEDHRHGYPISYFTGNPMDTSYYYGDFLAGLQQGAQDAAQDVRRNGGGNGWSPEEWLGLADVLGDAAIGITNALAGPQWPVQPMPPRQNSNNTWLMLGGLAIIIVLLILLLKR
jgi:hypothetical protein